MLKGARLCGGYLNVQGSAKKLKRERERERVSQRERERARDRALHII